MSTAHPWLELSRWTKKPLPREELERRIERALTLTNIGVLATSSSKGPIASPVEFYADGFKSHYPSDESGVECRTIVD